jgi:hypothetical protein
MASGRRDKKRLKDRRMKASKKAWHKRGLGRSRARRSRRVPKKSRPKVAKKQS